MTALEALACGRRLVRDPQVTRVASWARAAAVVIRHALELRVTERVAHAVPGCRGAPYRVALLCLVHVSENKDLARRVRQTWAELSQAVHHNTYELAPTPGELERWANVVEELCTARR